MEVCLSIDLCRHRRSFTVICMLAMYVCHTTIHHRILFFLASNYRTAKLYPLLTSPLLYVVSSYT